jgi:hypothetical protein
MCQFPIGRIFLTGYDPGGVVELAGKANLNLGLIQGPTEYVFRLAHPLNKQDNKKQNAIRLKTLVFISVT